MPQATDADREEYSKRFGDIGCEHAVAELTARGFILTKKWCWVAPARKLTDEEFFWLGFLVDEWDFGWLVASSPPEAGAGGGEEGE